MYIYIYIHTYTYAHNDAFKVTISSAITISFPKSLVLEMIMT